MASAALRSSAMPYVSIDVVSTRAIVRRLLDLCLDPENRAYIATEAGCIAGIAGYLQSSDVDVVYMALRVIGLLIPSNRALLLSHPGLLEQVRVLIMHICRTPYGAECGVAW